MAGHVSKKAFMLQDFQDSRLVSVCGSDADSLTLSCSFIKDWKRSRDRWIICAWLNTLCFPESVHFINNWIYRWTYKQMNITAEMKYPFFYNKEIRRSSRNML